MKGQVTMEFALISFFMIVLFASLFIALQGRMVSMREVNNIETMSQLGRVVTTEVRLAAQVGKGYYREFDIPLTLNGEDFEILVDDRWDLIIRYGDLEYVTFLEVPVTATLIKGKNSISHDGSLVRIQRAPVCGEYGCESREDCSTCPDDCGGPCAVCGDDVCDSGENCPGDIDSCSANLCEIPTCSAGCGKIFVSNGDTDSGLCDASVGCASPPCVCDGSGGCIISTTCGDGTCDSGESCPADLISCQENMCYDRTCDDGCGEIEVLNGLTDAGACDSTIGCDTLPCMCDGSGGCIPSCGDGITNGDEVCDKNGHISCTGTDYCNSDCSACVPTPITCDEPMQVSSTCSGAEIQSMLGLSDESACLNWCNSKTTGRCCFWDGSGEELSVCALWDDYVVSGSKQASNCAVAEQACGNGILDTGEVCEIRTNEGCSGNICGDDCTFCTTTPVPTFTCDRPMVQDYYCSGSTMLSDFGVQPDSDTCIDLCEGIGTAGCCHWLSGAFCHLVSGGSASVPGSGIYATTCS